MAATLTDVQRLDFEVREDGRVLVEVLEFLAAAIPLDAWPHDAVGALAQAIDVTVADQAERGKAERLRRHLFAGPPPDKLAERASGSPRRADRLRADLADLTPYGSGLYLVPELQ